MIQFRLNCGKCGHRLVILQKELRPESHCCGKCGELLLEIEPIRGSVYVLSNPAMPGLLKIGYTTRQISERVEEISNATGVPEPFVCKAHWLSFRPDIDEQKIHELFSRERSNGSREFFRISTETAIRQITVLMKGPPEERAETHISVKQSSGIGLDIAGRLTGNPNPNYGGFGSDRHRLNDVGN